MTTPRARAFLAAILVWLILPNAGSATAQELPARLTLAGQTAWTTNEESILRVAVLATNTGTTALDDLSLEIALGSPFVSRFDYETSLTEGPSSMAFATAVPVDGPLQPGQTRTLQAQLDMTTVLAVNREDSRVYPLGLQVLSGGTAVGSLTSAAIHLVREPEAPMLFTSWLELASGPAFAPDGTLVDPSLEAALAPDGALTAPLTALRTVLASETAETAIELVVEPALLSDLTDMTTGYVRADGTEVPDGSGAAESAKSFLAVLREVSADPSVQTVGLGYTGPTWPSLLGADLEVEARIQLFRGTQAIRGMLGVEPTTDLARPTEGSLDDASLAWLAGQGRVTILADVDEVDRPEQDLGFAPPPTAVIPLADGTATTLVLPDPGSDELLHRADLLADPLRAAQAVLGELAVIWKEQPVPGAGEQRGVALALPSSLPPLIWEPLLGRLARAPFLRGVHAQELVRGVVPAGPEAALRAPDTSAFSSTYADQIRTARRDVNAYASMLVEPTDEPLRLRDAILRAQAAAYVGNEPAGAQWLEEAERVTAAAFESTTPQVEQVFTFTSREGTIPLRLGDPGETPLTVTIQLQSSRFDFPGGDTQTVVLEGPDQIVSFDVVARASGRNPIRVVVFAPSGREIDRQLIAVQTTAVSGIALGITIVAAVGLLALYARRWIRRRKT